MAIRDLLDEEQWRARVVLWVMLAAFGLLLYKLWQMQVSRGASYQAGLERQSVRRVRLPGIRGRMFDRAGRCVADNRSGYTISLYLDELRRPGRESNTVAHVEAVLDDLARQLGLPRQVTTQEIRKHLQIRRPLPLPVWRDVSETTLARLAERSLGMSAVEISAEAVREYPFGPSACHVLGYCGRADPPTDEEPFHFYIPELVGRAGLEKQFDFALRGRAGGQLLLVDASGFRFKDLGTQNARAGRDLRLSLDMRVQQHVERALEGRVGAAVVVDPATGDILGMSSSPGFDPNHFTPVLSADEWHRLRGDERRPMINRAISANYSPGSTFKPVVALAALASGRGGPFTTFSCPGYFTLGQARFACWYAPGHGALNLRQAIERSCNVYFFQLALQCGLEPIRDVAAALGLGRATGIELEGEFAGLLPDDEWKRKTYDDGWRNGDTCNLAIGQGFLSTTPLQMALLTAALANGGTLPAPRLVLGRRAPGRTEFEEPPFPSAAPLSLPPGALRFVREAMRDVVMSPNGSGRLAKIPGVAVAGKTGTAEYGKKGEGKKLGWMIAFAPYDKPRYALALVVEEADTGGRTTAPIMKSILQGLFEEAPPARG